LETKDRPFHYLDFADGGTNAALNRWGQFMQLSRLVTEGDKPASFRYISVEPRNILRLEAMQSSMQPPPPEPPSELPPSEPPTEPPSGEDAPPHQNQSDWDPDNPEWLPSAEVYEDYPAYPRRHDKFDSLCMQSGGLGLRFAEGASFSEPDHYYRNDRWPEVRYTVGGNVKVVIQFFIQGNQIIQEMTLTSVREPQSIWSLNSPLA
jgi:hypothetical protein